MNESVPPPPPPETPPPYSQGNPYTSPGAQTFPPPLTADDRNMGMLCHLLGLCGFAAPGVGNVVGPLIFWLIQKDKNPSVDWHGKESLNFQITTSIALFVCSALMFVFVGFLIVPFVALFWLILTIIGGLKASNGEYYRYPLTIRFLK